MPTLHHADFAGRRRAFQLRIGEIGELEQVCGAGLGAVYARVATMQWRMDDLRETVRLGLIGGGATPAAAQSLVERYIDADDAPKGEALQLAADILSACINGVAAALGKPEGEGASENPATSPPSTRPAPPSDFAPAPSTE